MAFNDGNPQKDLEGIPKSKWYNKKPGKFGAPIANLIIYALFIGADVEFVFPYSRIVGLSLLVLCTGALTYLELYKTELINFGWWLFSCCLCVGAALMIFFLVGPELEVGWLQPANLPTPLNACSKVLPNDAVVFLFGTEAAFKSRGSNGEMPLHTVLQIGDCPSLSMRTDGDGAYINALIYDADGNSLGEIKDNKFTINKDRNLTIEKSGDLSTLVVHDKAGNEVIYVRFINANTFKIRGVFSCPYPFKQSFKATSNNKNVSGNCSGNNGLGDFAFGVQ